MVFKKYAGAVLVLALLWTDLAPAATVQNFQGGAGNTPYTLKQYEGAPGAAVVNGSLLMVNTYSQRNVIAFNQTDPGLYRRIIAEWDMSIAAGADGLSFALLDTSVYGTSGAGPALDEEPSLPSVFAVGFDVYCPDDYQRKGSHEISLHFDGVERANKWSSFDYRTGTFTRVRVEIDFVTGGAEISVFVSDRLVYDRYFLAGMRPFDCRAAFGARTGGLKTTAMIDNISVSWQDPGTTAAPLSGTAFNRQLMNGSARNVSKLVTFPSSAAGYERVIMRLIVEEPPGGWDGWDRMMAIYIWDAAQQNRYEIGRYMTPYSKAGTWWFDVTDYQTLLAGQRKMEMWVDSWVGNQEDQEGYWFTVQFDYYPGDPKYRVLGVQNLWNGTPVYGNLNDPTMSNFFRDKQVTIPAGAVKTKLRFMVTGHGQSPNSESGAEFIARHRTATVNGNTWTNLLWKDDCYLNPCRPQGGTWKYSRAGWAPGDQVTPWDIDVSGHVAPGKTAAIDYTAEEYYNYTPEVGNNARHWVESQLIYYGYADRPDPIAHWPANERSGTVLADLSDYGFNGTLTNMDAESWTGGKRCGGLSFDGVDDYVTFDGFSGIAGSQNRTCMAWIKTTRINGGIITWGLLQPGQKWNFGVDSWGGLGLEVNSGYICSTTPIADGQWHHVAAVFANDGSPNVSDVRLFVDGRRETPSRITPRTIDTSGAQAVSLGSFGSGTNFFFEGLIDEARIYARALSDAEIETVYRSQALGADLETDGVVNLGDLAAMAFLWNAAGVNDMTCDGRMDMDDLLVLIDEWLTTY